ncbi:hypothetical protein [Raineya orbicola]|uniref:Uncharacterized protein n=1 Tax=Raineya orbicola TaxID=2016530 RepID=A0A2N3I8E5_9BACT|nr:hypothetical protein [Raineya orbicola]PKQ66550.1 hypothetical protein Rain11_2345 [Raineya orbicola]
MKKIFVLIILLLTDKAFAQQSVPFTLDDRDRLIKIEQRLIEMDKRFEQVDKRFEELRADMNARFEQIDKRFEQVDKRFEQVDKRFEQQMNFLWILTTIFATVTAAALGFAWWDRRTMIRPFETKVRTIEEEIALNKKDIKNMVFSFRELAQKDAEVAEILKKYNLL